MNERSQKHEADRVENINMHDDSFTPFESTSQEVSDLIDDLDHPIKYLFGDIHDKIQNINTEMDSVFKGNNPSVRRKATEAIFLLSAMLSVAGCKSSPYKSPEDFKEPTPKEETLNTLEDESTTPTKTEEPVSTPSKTEEPKEEELEENLSFRPTGDYGEEMERYGYIISTGNIVSKDSLENQEGALEIIMFDFKFLRDLGTDSGRVIRGRSEVFKEDNQTLEFLVNPNVSNYAPGSGRVYYLDSAEVIEKWLNTNKTYILHILLQDEDGEVVKLSSYDNYTEGEWYEIRDNVNRLINKTAEPSNWGLMIHRIYTQ